MKVIFLDIDGVLNCSYSKSECCGKLGIDNDKVKRLRQIVTASDARLVLCSTWKDGWEKTDKEQQSEEANYLDRKLKRERLWIMDKTTDLHTDRGAGILRWIEGKRIESWIVIDDEEFDYKELGIVDRVVRTEYYSENGGLQDEHVQAAIDKLLV